MRQKPRKSPNKDLVEDDRWKRKGGAHKLRYSEPSPCPDCKGFGFKANIDHEWVCDACEGTGEIWK